MEMRYKIWLDQDGKAFGTGPYNILVNVEKEGSLNEAARKMGMSYSKAWKIVNMVEKRLGIKFLLRKIGGNEGGGSYLTEEGKAFMERYAAFRKEADEALAKIYERYYGGKNDDVKS